VNQWWGNACSGTGRIGGGAGALHSWVQSAQRNVSTSGLWGMTRRPLADAQAGQTGGKINKVDPAPVFHN
jgi:hypothetical protein